MRKILKRETEQPQTQREGVIKGLPTASGCDFKKLQLSRFKSDKQDQKNEVNTRQRRKNGRELFLGGKDEDKGHERN